MSPQEIQQAQAQLKQQGYVPPASSGQPVSGYDQIDAEMAKRQTAATDTEANPKLDGQDATFSSVGGAIGNDFNTRADNVGKIENSNDNVASKVLQIGGEGAGVIGDTVGEVVKSVIKPELLKSFGEPSFSISAVGCRYPSRSSSYKLVERAQS